MHREVIITGQNSLQLVGCLKVTFNIHSPYHLNPFTPLVHNSSIDSRKAVRLLSKQTVVNYIKGTLKDTFFVREFAG